MKYTKTCEHCHHTATAFTHSLNAGLVQAFSRFVEKYYEVRRPVNPNTELVELLTHNQLANWQKLRYFGLIQSVDGQGFWVPTRTGMAFYHGEEPVYATVATINAEVIPLHHDAWDTHSKLPERKYMGEIMGTTGYKKRPEYQEEKGSRIQTLF